jgi:hypothetical protein
MISRAKLLSKLLVAALLILSSPQPTEKKFKHRHFAPAVEKALIESPSGAARDAVAKAGENETTAKGESLIINGTCFA